MIPEHYQIILLPPSKPGRDWMGYAKDSDAFGDDDTPDHTKAWASTPAKCATAVANLLRTWHKERK